jgi:hypothetical protein
VCSVPLIRSQRGRSGPGDWVNADDVTTHRDHALRPPGGRVSDGPQRLRGLDPDGSHRRVHPGQDTDYGRDSEPIRSCERRDVGSPVLSQRDDERQRVPTYA